MHSIIVVSVILLLFHVINKLIINMILIFKYIFITSVFILKTSKAGAVTPHTFNIPIHDLKSQGHQNPMAYSSKG